MTEDQLRDYMERIYEIVMIRPQSAELHIRLCAVLRELYTRDELFRERVRDAAPRTAEEACAKPVKQRKGGLF